MPDPAAVNILGSWIRPMGCEETVALILRLAREGAGGHVCLANVHTVVTGRQDRRLQEATNSAVVTLADGKPLAWVARFRGLRSPRQVRGADLFRATCAAAAREGISVYLYGGSPPTVKRLAEKLLMRNPRLVVAGWESPPYRKLTPREESEAIERIAGSGARIVWVGLGAPKQEKWMLDHRDSLPGIVKIGIGAAFDFEAGEVNEAPRWIQALGLEWMHRLSQDPRRLWRRYIRTNLSFVYLNLREALGISKEESR